MMQNVIGFWSKRETCQYHYNRNVFQCRHAARGFTHNVLFFREGCNNPDSLIARLNCASIKSRCLLTLQKFPRSFIKWMHFNYPKKQFQSVVKFELRSEGFTSARRAGFILRTKSRRMSKRWETFYLSLRWAYHVRYDRKHVHEFIQSDSCITLYFHYNISLKLAQYGSWTSTTFYRWLLLKAEGILSSRSLDSEGSLCLCRGRVRVKCLCWRRISHILRNLKP